MSTVILPDFQMDVTGQTDGGAYWTEAEYRVEITVAEPGEKFTLRVEDTMGTRIDTVTFSAEQAERLIALVGTDETADDEGLGLTRELFWRLGDLSNDVGLNMAVLTEVAEWLGYALGHEEYDGPNEWER